jgi:hypothetical protein
MQYGLTLLAAAGQITALAMFANLRNVARDRFPTPYLAFIILAAPAQVITTVPLEPTARVILVNPTLRAPHGE